MPPQSNIDHNTWYEQNRPAYTRLAALVRSMIESLLASDGIEFHTLSHRAKTSRSFAEKIERKHYDNPRTEMHDLAGIRVITYVQSEANKAGALISKTFNVHPDKSLDKSTELGVDRVGYRSIHFVCDLGTDRTKLPEYSVFKGMVFEIQVRTALQHAWAEVEHDRNYKFGGKLPTEYQRRLSILAGSLELADNEFDRLSHEIDEYAKRVAHGTEKGKLDFEINSTSLHQYLEKKLPELFAGTNVEIVDTLPSQFTAQLLSELEAFGIKSLAELDHLISPRYLELAKKYRRNIGGLGFVRNLLMFADPHKYFSTAWQKHWELIHPQVAKLFTEHFGTRFTHLLKKYNIKVLSMNKSPFAQKSTKIRPRSNTFSTRVSVAPISRKNLAKTIGALGKGNPKRGSKRGRS